METVMSYIKPELLILVAVLNVVGAGLKRSRMPDRWIPLILGLSGIGLSLIWVLSVSELHGCASVLTAIFTAAVQGILTAGASVYAHQLVKQLNKGNSDDGNSDDQTNEPPAAS